MGAVALLPALAVVAGGSCGAALHGPPSVLALWALAIAVAGAAVAYLKQKDTAFVVCTVAAFFCGGWALAADAKQKALETPLRAALGREFGGFDINSTGPVGRHDPIRVRGVITEDASVLDDVTMMRVRVSEIRIQGTR